MIHRFDREHRRQILRRMVRLQVGRLIGDIRVSSRMCLGEAVASKLDNHVEDMASFGLGDVIGDGAIHEALPLLLHDVGFLLAHSTTKQVGLTQAVAGHLLRDLKDLILIDDDAQSFFSEVDDRGMQVLKLGSARLSAHIIIHHAGLEWARTIERHQWNDLAEGSRLKLKY